MLQSLEREPQEDTSQIYDASPAPGRVPFVNNNFPFANYQILDNSHILITVISHRKMATGHQKGKILTSTYYINQPLVNLWFFWPPVLRNYQPME